MTNWERLNKKYLRVTHRLEAARLREGNEAMRAMLKTLGLYQMSAADLARFELWERVRTEQAQREEETGPGAEGGDAAPDPDGDSAGREDDEDEDEDKEEEMAAQTSVRDEADPRDQEAGNESAWMAAERAPRLEIGPRRCPHLGLSRLLHPKKRQRR